MEAAGLACTPILAVGAYLKQLNQLAADSPALVLLGLILFATTTVASSFSKPFRIIVFGLLLYAGSLERPESTQWYSLLMSPVMQPLSTYSRIVTIGLLICLLLPVIFIPQGNRRKLFSIPLAALVSLQILNAIRIAGSGGINRFVVTLPTTLAVCLLAAFVIGKTMQSYRDVRLILLAIIGSVGLIVLGTLHELLVNPTGVFANNRLYGTTANPQFMGSLLALTLPSMLYFIMLAPRSAWMKPIISALAVASALGIAATGSRTGLLAAVLGLSALFRRNALRMLLITTLVIGVTAIISLYLEETGTATRRLLSKSDTRSETWMLMVQDFLDNPAIGKSSTGSASAESSYLGVAARMGVVGLAFLAWLIYAIARLILQLNRLKPQLGKDAPLADIVIGAMLGMGAACMFDAYLFGAVTWHIMYLYTMLAVGQALRDIADTNASAARPILPASQVAVPAIS